MWIGRDFSERILAAARARPAVVVTGARQVGKSALVRRLFPEHSYVSLDLPSLAAEAEEEPASFLARFPPPVVIDEVQYAPGLFRHVKRVIDEHRDRRGQFILTGSQKFQLMHSVSDSLAGRVAVLDLLPLSFSEIRGAYPDYPLAMALLRGGYPELYADPELSAPAFYRAYLATYLERDLRQLLKVVHLRDFERFVRACAFRSAQILNKSDLARDVGISPSTANEWLGALEASNQVALLEPWFSNQNKSLVKSPKLYLCDTGLLCALLNISSVDELLRSPHVGAIWETLVFNELRKTLDREDAGPGLFYWRDRKTEVDFLRHKGGRFTLWEAKWSEFPDARDTAGLVRVRAELGATQVDGASVVCRAPASFALGDGLRARGLLDL